MNYSPLKSQGELPEIFTQNIRNTIKTDLSELNKGKEKDKSIKSDYYTSANYEIEKIVKSGNTLINDEVTRYLNKITDKILANNPDLRKQLHIYTLKSSVVNAYSYDKGYIFMDIGLLAQVESEAQLAYILCHEISHYVKKHNINEYVKSKKIDKATYNGKSNEEKLIEKCQYSKEQESEADVEGLRLLEQTRYDLKEAEKSFDVLQYSHLPFELIEFDKSLLESKYFKIPDKYFLKEVASIRNNSNEDDTKHTHPNTTKRKQAARELINIRDNNGRELYLIGKTEFDYIRDLTRMEVCRLYLINRDYPNALYAAYILNKKYPDNEYITEIISKSLYGLTLFKLGYLHYNEDSYLYDGIPPYAEIESFPQQVYHLIHKMPDNEWAIMSLNYVYRAHRKFPANKTLNAYSDTLMKFMSNINWGIIDFVRVEKKEKEIKTDSAQSPGKSKSDVIASLQVENNFRNYDTMYYKTAFLDLFVSDKDFSAKFPATGSASNTRDFLDYRFKNSGVRKSKNKNREYLTANVKVEKVLLLEPFYIKADGKKDEILYVTSDEKQEKLIKTISDCAARQKFELVTLDPGLISSSDVDKINDYSVINDWFSEKFDGSERDANPILNTNEIDKIIAKYGTQYVLKSGIISYKLKGTRKRTYYYGFIYDLKKNEMIYRKYEIFRDNDAQDLIYGKIYQTFYELKHSQ